MKKLELKDKGKVHLKLEYNNEKYEVIKKYNRADLDKVLDKVSITLKELFEDGLPDGVKSKVKYLLDEKFNQKVKEVRKEN